MDTASVLGEACWVVGSRVNMVSARCDTRSSLIALQDGSLEHQTDKPGLVRPSGQVVKPLVSSTDPCVICYQDPALTGPLSGQL